MSGITVCHETEAIARVREFDNAELAEQFLRQPLRTTTWQNLDQLAAVDPELATDRWESIVDDAVNELESGHSAAKAVESGTPDCWTRAEFLALREQLSRDWQPQNGVEQTLIDSMTQAHTLKVFWMQRMVAIDALASADGTSDRLQLARVNEYRAIEQAAAMADRFDRLFQRSLRQLRDLRRYVPSVVVQHAGQVNVAQQQLNVGGGSDTGNGEAN